MSDKAAQNAVDRLRELATCPLDVDADIASAQDIVTEEYHQVVEAIRARAWVMLYGGQLCWCAVPGRDVHDQQCTDLWVALRACVGEGGRG